MSDKKTTPKTVELVYTGVVSGSYWDGGWKKIAVGGTIEVPAADKDKWLTASTWELVETKPAPKKVKKAEPKTDDNKESE